MGKSAGKNRTPRPIMVLLDGLGRRWALRILWELKEGPLTFRALRDATGGISPSVLNDRLAELRELGIVERTDDGYAFTQAGVELAPILLSLNAWAQLRLPGR